MSDFGLNFRATSGFVTDPANTTYILITDAYPTTRGGFTFGATTSISLGNPVDRNAGLDPRLAGFHYNNSATKNEYQLDLTAGSYDIQLACGDSTYLRTMTIEVLDNTTSLFTVTGTTSGGNRFMDALGNFHPTSWVPSSAEAKTNQSISSGTLKWKNGDGVSSQTGWLAHLRVTSVVVAPPLGFGKISSNRKYFLPGEAAILLAALESKRRFTRRRFFQWLPGALWRK